MLKIALNLNLDASYKSGGFSKILSKKNLEFILSNGNGIILFYLSLLLLLVQINLILEKWGHKRDILIARDTGYIEIVFAFFTKLVALYI